MKLIIFDVDGTLCHSKSVDDKCYINAFKSALNIDISNTDWNKYKHVTDYFITRDIITKTTGIVPDNKTISAVIDHYAEGLMKRVKAEPSAYNEIPGAKKIIDYLNSDTAYSIGVATGGFFRTAKFKLDTIGFNIDENKIYGSDNYISKYEIISAFIENEKKENNKFEKIFYVGDREYDFKTANELGIDFLGIDYDRNSRLKNAGAKNVANDFLPPEKVLSMLN